jgi:lipid A 3-O-deacylase
MPAPCRIVLLVLIHAAVAPAQPAGTDLPPLQLDVPARATPQPDFGAPGTDWLTLGLSVADDFDQSTDYNLHGAWSRFIIQDVEFGVEADVWYFDQDQDPAVGVGAGLLLRWHFVSRPTWSLYTDVGMGLLGSTDDVPDDGLSFNFTPRAGFGATFDIAWGARLDVGVGWHHISNARIFGDADNPGRDAPIVSIGIRIPF